MLSRAFATATAKVPLTVGRFPGYVRDARFAKVTAAQKKKKNMMLIGVTQLNEYDVNVFKTILAAGAGSSSGIETGPEALEKYNTDWLRKYRGMSSLVLKPKSTQEVSKILKHCNERRYAMLFFSFFPSYSSGAGLRLSHRAAIPVLWEVACHCLTKSSFRPSG